MNTIRTSIFILLCYLSVICNGQQIIDTKVIGIDEGLRERIVYQIERDPLGYFYVRQANFLQIWDGRDFTDVDITELRSQSELKESEIFILKDSTAVLIPNSSPNTYYQIDKYARKLRQKNWSQKNIHKAIVNNGNLYAISLSDQSTTISILNPIANTSTLLVTLNRNMNIKDLHVTSESILLQSYNDDIYSCDLSGKLIIDQEIKGNIISNQKGITLVASNSIIYKYGIGGVKEIHNIKKSGYFTKWAEKDKNGNILIAHTDKERYFKKLTLVTKDLKIINYDSLLIRNNRILDIYADDFQDKLLLGSYNHMLYYHLLHHSVEHTDCTSLHTEEKFGKVISGTTYDKNGQIYFVREYHGLYKYIPGAKQSTQILNDNQSQFFNNNLRINYDSTRHQLWSFGYNYNGPSTMYRYDIASEEAIKIDLDFSINDFIIENENSLIIVGKQKDKISNPKQANLQARVGRLNLNTLVYSDVNIIPKFIDEIYSVYKDGHFIFLGSKKNGLLITNPKMSQIAKHIDSNHTPDSIDLKSNFAYSTTRIKDHYVVSMQGDGILLIDTKRLEPIKKITSSDGLSDNNVASVLSDDSNNIWVTTFNGLNLLDTNYNVIRTIQERDGLSHREFNGNASIYYDDHLFLGTLNGMTKINPDSFLTQKSSKKISIDNIEIIHQSTDDIQRFSGNSTNINIDNVDSRLIIQPTITDYYSYKNDKGISDIIVNSDLSNAIKNDKIEFSNLRTGVHKLQLSYPHSDNRIELDIEIRNNYFRYWKSILAILLTMIFSYLISLYFINKAKEREAEKTTYNKKIAELQLNALKSQMNPHFIFNCLGAIQYFIQTQDTAKADEYLSKFAKLMRLILESSKNDYISLKDEMSFMELYIDLEYIRFEGLFDFIVNIDSEVDDELMIPPMIVQPLVENAINHGLFNLKNRKGLLEVITTRISDDEIKIVIRDNGVGRAYQSKSKKPNHKSRGMDILKERISIINSNNKMYVDLEINDLVKTQKLGTEIIINIKYSA